MFKKLTIMLLIFTVLPTWAARNYILPPMDTSIVKQQTDDSSGPLKYAEATAINDIYIKDHKTLNGEWQKLANSQQQYDLRISSKNATSLNIGMQDFFLPPSAELWVSNDDKSILRGPYTDRYNPQNGYFWIGDVPGDHVNLRITVSPEEKQYLSFNVNQIARGFYAYWKTPSENNLKSGSCNIDVACPEGDDWRPEINSVGQYSFQTSDGGYVCTGQLINNTAQNGKPYFLSASHCGYTDSTRSQQDSVAASINIIWNYQSKTCRIQGSSANSSPISKSTFNQRQAGATYIASNASSDFVLLRLNQTPDAQFNIQYSGWDRSDVAFNGGVAIHHPSGHAKRISFDYDPLVIIGLNSNNQVVAGTSHLQVVSWDLGTTEKGSSGSGLWNDNFRLVGQLHAGSAACGNEGSDYYGRFYYSWDKGTTADSRLKDWLDPVDSKQMTLDTTGRCQAPNVSINIPANPQVGSQVTYTANVSGGSGNYQYAWDINGDGHVDGTAQKLETRYQEGYIGNISLTVIDDNGCQSVDSRAVIVKSPDIQLQGEPQLTQVCGNNDGTIDPGERWRATFQLKNNGSPTASNSFAMFSKNPNQVAAEGSDIFGNQYTACEKQFINISQNSNLLPWVKAPQWTNYAANDMGSVKVQLNKPFDHYGEPIPSLVVSTNGYLSTNPSAIGVDYTNDCPIPVVPDYDTGGRISPLHADLQGSNFYHKYFATCPREGESGASACEVFTWKSADFVDTQLQTEKTDFQAILYSETSQWVFQYDDSSMPTNIATVGMQNQAGDDALMIGCNQFGTVQTEQALCIYNNKQGLPAKDTEDFEIVTPVKSLGNLAANQSRQVQVEFAIAADAACGEEYGIDYQAAIYDQGFNQGQDNIIRFQVAEGNQCQRITQCEIDDSNTINPKKGLWWNPERSGNGLEMNVLDKDRLLYIMYTGLPDRSPVWYTADDDDSAFNNYHNKIYKVAYPGGFESGNKQFSLVGWSDTYFLNSLNALQVRKINGQVSAEKLSYQQLDTQATTNEHTGQYYTPTEPGWGQSVSTEGRYRVIISYIYDLEGAPYWTYASGYNNNSALTAGHYESFCPHCPSVVPDAQAVGEIKMQFNGQTDGLINFYDIKYPTNSQQITVDWQRSQLPVTNLIPQK